MTESNSESLIDKKAPLLLKPALRVLCLTVIILSVAGAATSSDPSTAQGLFIAILVIMCRVLRSSGSGKSKYQINEKAVKKTGEVNAGFTDEKNTSEVKSGDSAGQEPWMNNYVPYGKNPSGNPIDQVTFTNEQEREAGENVDKEELKKNENWKENYVAYQDKEKEQCDNKEKEQEEVPAGEEEEEKDADEKDSYEKEEGKEKI